MTADHELPIEPLGRYVLQEELARGGQGIVYRAYDAHLGREIAFKVLRPAAGSSDPGSLSPSEARFVREARVTAQLDHPGIAPVHEVGRQPSGALYVTQKLLRGRTLAAALSACRNLQERLGLLQAFVSVCQAVAYAHERGVIHRDLKPSNVMLGELGEAVVVDWGLARTAGVEGPADTTRPPVDSLLEPDSGGTREGSVIGTPAYMSPEQAAGANARVDARSDVWSLGVILYELLAGHKPFEGRSAAEVLQAIAAAPVVPMRTACPEAPADLAAVCERALSRDPLQRYSSAKELAAEISAWLSGGRVTAHEYSSWQLVKKFVRRNRTAVALAALAFSAAVAGSLGTMTQARTARRQRDFALGQLSRAEAINDLTKFVLSDAAPSGKPFTARELLARAEQIAHRQPRKRGASEVEILISIGRQYWELDEDANALRLLTEAYDLSRGLVEQSTRAKASCALASALARTDQVPRAEALFQQGLAELPDESQFAIDRVFCLLRGSEVAREGNHPDDAVDRAQAARRVLRESSFDSEVLQLQALMSLAESYRWADRPREASAAFEQASTLLASLGRDDTETAGTLLNNWGMTLWGLGLPIEAERVFRRAIAISATDGSEQGVSPMLLNNEARVLRELGRLGAAADYAERAYAKARGAGDDVVINQSLLVRASTYRESGDLGRAGQMLSELEPRLRRKFSSGHIAFAGLTNEKAMIARVRGDLPAALDLFNQAVSIAEASVKAGGQGVLYVPALLLHRSNVELQLRRPDEAAADAQQALRMLHERTPPGARSSLLGRAYSSLAAALQVQGKRDEARAALTAALEHLQDCLGPDHAETRSALELQSLTAQSR